MKALEFETTLTTDSKLTVPADLAVQIPKAEAVRVIVLLPDGSDADWQHLTAEQFLAGYSDSDSIYDAV
jgi:hypothetical protein